MEVVRIDPRGRAQEHVVKVKKDEDENLTWCALGNGGPWKVTFDKGTPNPFGPAGGAPPFYTVPKGGCVQTQGGPVNGNVGVTYKYNVRDPSLPGEPVTNDPDVDVE